MEARNYIGLGILFIGVGLQPVGWMYSMKLSIVSLVLIFIGVMVFCTQKYLDYVDDQKNSSYGRGTGLSGDIEGHSGWANGGKSTAYQNSNEFGCGGSDSSGCD